MDDRTVIEWDKDDIDTLGILKVDVLGAWACSRCIRKAFDLLARHEQMAPASTRRLFRQRISATYDMLCVADADSLACFRSKAGRR